MDLMSTAQLLGNFGEFFGAIAVVVTLAYLAFQVRQNSTQVRLNSVQISVERLSGIISFVLDDPDKFVMWRDGLDSYSSLPPEQQAQFHSHMMKGITAHTHNRQLFESGAIPKEFWLGQRLEMARVLKCPGSKQWLESLNFEAGTQTELAAMLEAEVEVGSGAVPLNQALPFLRK